MRLLSAFRSRWFDDCSLVGKAILPDPELLRTPGPLAEAPKSHRNALSNRQIRAVHDLYVDMRLGRVARVAAVRDALPVHYLVADGHPNRAGLQMGQGNESGAAPKLDNQIEWVSI